MHTTLEPIPTELDAPKAPMRPSRRKFLRALGTAGVILAGGSVYATQIEPFWLDVHEMDVPVTNLPPAFDGFRIAHLTDLHAGDSVPIEYLVRAVERVNALNPDCVAVTGDLVTHSPQWVEPVVQVLSALRSPVYVTFGNHDYAPWNACPGPTTIIADALEQKLSAAGCIVLRNCAVPMHRGVERIWMVGLEDLYTDRFLPNLAFWRVPKGETKICLSHNPDGTKSLVPHEPDLILSGHTHGGQVRLPLIGAIKLPVSDRSLDKGRFKLPHGELYVSRGVGFLARVRFDCRPEIPVFRLTRA